MFTKLNRVLLASGLAVATGALMSPAAFAGSGGVAGSAAFNITGGAVQGVATAASVGKNGASAWAFQTGTTNSAGALGTAGIITITTFSATNVTSVNDTPDAALATNQANTIAGGPDVQLGEASGDIVVNSP